MGDRLGTPGVVGFLLFMLYILLYILFICYVCRFVPANEIVRAQPFLISIIWETNRSRSRLRNNTFYIGEEYLPI